MSSPFAIAGPRLRENGISCLPIMPGAKVPGAYSGAHGWRLESKWQRLCDRTPTGFEMQIWEKWPDAGVAVALGSGSAPAGLQLVAADIDTDDAAVIAAIMGVLPPSPVRKRGRKGECLFYLAPLTVQNKPYNNGDKQRILDLLAHGRQTVLPPSVHPDTGAPYVWLTVDTLEDYTVADLPHLPADVNDRLAEALAPFGYAPPPALTVVEGGLSLAQEDRPHRLLNEAALQQLDAWVPALGLTKCRKAYDAYKAVAHWRPSSSGRPLSARAANLTIRHDGIKDCGENKGYTALDLVMAACGADLDTAFKWLSDRVAPAPEPVMLAPKGGGDLAGLGELAPPPVVEDATPPASGKGVIPAALCTPPGLLGEIITWMNAASERPSPQLNLGAALCFLGAIIGRRYEGPTRARTNLYGVGVADTGHGKSYPPKAIISLGMAASLQRFFGGQALKSDGGLRKLLETKPTVLMPIDEMGGLLKKILNRRASSHEAGIRDMLLALFSAADSTYFGSEGATERAVAIHNPNLCMFGVSTPSDFWSAFTSANAEDGLLPRFLIFDGGPDKPRATVATADISEPPRVLVKRLHGLMDTRPPGNLNGVTGDGNTGVKPIRATWCDGAEAVYRAMQAEMDDKATQATGIEKIVHSRVAEHTIKLALIYAVGIEHARPVITVEALAWARAVVDHSSAALLAGMDGRVADSDKQAEYLAVLRMVREAGPSGILESALMRQIRGVIDLRRYNDIVEQLRMAGEVEKGILTPAGGGRPGVRLWTTGRVREAV